MITLAKHSQEVLIAGSGALPRVNLLPPEIAEQRHLRHVQAGLAGGVVAAVAVVALAYVAATGGVSTANDQLASSGARQRAVQAESARYRDVTATYKRAADAQALLAVAMGQEVRYSRFLNDLALSMPANVWVTNLAFTQGDAGAAAAATAAGGIGSVSISGVAYDHEDVAAWLESLAGTKGYTAPTLQSSTEALIGTRPVVNWSTTVSLSSDALSGRYTTSTTGS